MDKLDTAMQITAGTMLILGIVAILKWIIVSLL